MTNGPTTPKPGAPRPLCADESLGARKPTQASFAVSSARRPTRLPSPIAGLLSRIYVAEINRRNRAFDRGRNVSALDRPVISVGNLSAGGTGKTPAVRTLCTWLLEAGLKPCIAMRGYKPGPHGSDEQLEYERTLPGVPVIAHPNRAAALDRFLASPRGAGTDCVVLDDGFQHRRLARHLDIVLIDASRSPFEDAPLPLGFLREPPGSLGRAQAVIVTHAELVQPVAVVELIARIKEINPAITPAVCSHEWSELCIRDIDGSIRCEHVHWMRGKRALAVCAIGNPQGFFAAATCALAREPVGTIQLADHAPFSKAQIARIQRAIRRFNAEIVLVTIKDDVKLARNASLDVPVVAPHLVLGFQDGQANLRDLVLSAARGAVP
ncbi:MAG: tetraacyldisaccharide 4'-kinase [Planctomycetota bacterium]|nr:MAG: tetraacyldisaccharide 4'-kinase [Planctomycetota bacterium]